MILKRRLNPLVRILRPIDPTGGLVSLNKRRSATRMGDRIMLKQRTLMPIDWIFQKCTQMVSNRFSCTRYRLARVSPAEQPHRRAASEEECVCAGHKRASTQFGQLREGTRSPRRQQRAMSAGFRASVFRL
jgi:hypothetical protein